MDMIPDFFIIICVTIAAFLIYLAGSTSSWFSTRAPRETRKTIFLNRVFGFFCYGVIPAATAQTVLSHPPEYYGLIFSGSPGMLWWLAGAVPVMVLIGFLANRSTEGTDMYPQVRIKQWNAALILENAISWMLYLTGYEFFFRGFLLFGSLEVLDIWSAIALNAVIYALMHLHKNLRETIGSVPFGGLLALAAWQTGSIWTGIGIHTVLAISNFLWAIRLNPEFSFNFHRNRSTG